MKKKLENNHWQRSTPNPSHIPLKHTPRQIHTDKTGTEQTQDHTLHEQRLNEKNFTEEEIFTISKKHNFKKYTPRDSSYDTRRKKSRLVIWPFIIMLPIFILGYMIDNLLASANTVANETNEIQQSNIKGSSAQKANNSQDNIASHKTAARSQLSTYSSAQIADDIQHTFSLMPHSPPALMQEHILSKPVQFAKDLKTVFATTEPELLLLVDKQHHLDKDYAPIDIEPLDKYRSVLLLNRDDLSLRKNTLDSLITMSQLANADNITLLVSSSYRSYTYQNTVFNRIANEIGLEQAERESARPGTSQHQLGTAVDFGSITPEFAYTDASKWLVKNAAEFGFSLSYPDQKEWLTGYTYESWHYRYIGSSAALFQNEYFDGSQQYFLEFLNYIPESSILKKLESE